MRIACIIRVFEIVRIIILFIGNLPKQKKPPNPRRPLGKQQIDNYWRKEKLKKPFLLFIQIRFACPNTSVYFNLV